MILFDLKCGNSHVFEAWFRDGAAYDAQAAARAIECPVCASTEIVKAPMAPRLSAGAAEPPAPQTANRRRAAAALRRICEEIVRNSEDVGKRFPEEARKIHYGEVDPRAIRGESTREEFRELREEGIEVIPLVIPRTDS